MLCPGGTIIFGPDSPGEIRADGSLAMRFPWWRGEGIQGALQIEGRRLDGQAPLLAADIPEGYGDTGFLGDGHHFPV